MPNVTRDLRFEGQIVTWLKYRVFGKETVTTIVRRGVEIEYQTVQLRPNHMTSAHLSSYTLLKQINYTCPGVSFIVEKSTVLLQFFILELSLFAYVTLFDVKILYQKELCVLIFLVQSAQFCCNQAVTQFHG